LVKDRIDGSEKKVVFERLADEHAVKWIAMVHRKHRKSRHRGLAQGQ